mmetsp:Transcript_49174/g.87783  ORF Transcript_49174/g.87783 Transcript_49174/m.87783 type:complete len:94 (+) Transcript_49174:718-999(+)
MYPKRAKMLPDNPKTVQNVCGTCSAHNRSPVPNARPGAGTSSSPYHDASPKQPRISTASALCKTEVVLEVVVGANFSQRADVNQGHNPQVRGP